MALVPVSKVFTIHFIFNFKECDVWKIGNINTWDKWVWEWKIYQIASLEIKKWKTARKQEWNDTCM